MKIALVIPYDLSYPGGVLSHVQHLAEAFTSAGHQVIIYGPTSDPSGLKANMVGIGRPMNSRAGGSNARMSQNPMLLPQIKQILSVERFDLVHVHDPYVSFMTIAWLRAVKEETLVATFHAARDKNRAALYQFMHHAFAYFFTKIDGCIAVSQPAKALVNRYYPEIEFEIIPNGVDVKLFENKAVPRPELEDGKTNILFVGRLEEKRKGVKYLLQAYKKLKPLRPNIRLVVVGGTSEKALARFKREVDYDVLADVVFTGYVPDDELLRYYHSVQIFVAPNTGNESQGIILLEALAASLPIVASNISGFAEVLTDSYDSLLFQPRNSNELMVCLCKLVDDESLRLRLSASAHLRAQNFDWRVVTQQVLSFYERAELSKQKRLSAVKTRRFFLWPST